MEQASRLLICLGKSSGSKMTLTEICEQIGIHKSKGYSILNTLIQFGFVEKDPRAKTYSLGPGLIFLARNVLDNLDLKDIAGPFLEQLAKETRTTALLGLISGEYVYIAARHEGDQNIGVTIRPGHRFHITHGAHGKAIAAFMPEADREKILQGKELYFHGSAEYPDMKRLTDELAKCRESGFAQDSGELHPGINAVSTPLFGSSGEIAGCVILIGTFPEAMIEEYGHKLVGIAKKISYKLGADIQVFR